MNAESDDEQRDAKADNAKHGLCVAINGCADEKWSCSEDAKPDADHQALAVLGSVIILPLFNHAVYAVSELDGLLFEEFIGFKLTPVKDELGDAAGNEQ